MERGGWVVICARRGAGAARKYRLPKSLALVASILFVTACCAISLAFFHYLNLWHQASRHEQLLAERDGLLRESRRFRILGRQLYEQLEVADTAARKLEIMSGLAERGRGGQAGVGGPSPASAALMLDRPEDLARHFDFLDRRRQELQATFVKLQDYYTARQILLASMPSIMPANGIMGDGLGYRKDPFSGARKWHNGLDIQAPRGTRVVATADGQVTYAGWRSGYGKCVVVRHRLGFETYYGHLSKITVEKGDTVKRRDVLGYVGSTGRSTGNHVHFEVRFRNDTLDPQRLIREEAL